MKGMKKALTIITLLVLAACCMAEKNSDYDSDMRKAFDKFIESKEIKTMFTHPGTGHYVWYFKYIYDKPHGGTYSVPKPLARLDEAFLRNAGKATTTLSYNPKEGNPPFGWMKFSWPDTYWSRICFTYNLKDNYNFRLVTLTGQDNHRTCYAMMWMPDVFYDKDSVLCHAIDGYLIKMKGKHWRIDDLNDTYVSKMDMKIRNMEPVDSTEFTILRDKVKYIANMYDTNMKNNDGQGCDVAAYFLSKIASDFNGMLTEKQYEEIGSIVSGMMADKTSERRQSVIAQVLDRMMNKVKGIKKRNVWRHARVMNNRRFLNNWYQCRTLMEEFRIPDSVPEPIKEWTVSGMAVEGTKSLGVRYLSFSSYDGTPESIPVDENGMFTFKRETMPGQFIEITDGGDNSYVFIADTVPVFVDMTRRMVKASPLNMKFAACQRREYDYVREARKYNSMIDNGHDCIDEEGMLRLIDSVGVTVRGFIRDNMDSPIAAYYLSREYPVMEYEELSSMLDSTKAYASHISMQPVWKYYENMKKRLPGTMYRDVELVDTAGRPHRLSEYVGKGYVLLDFWMVESGPSRSEFPMLKKLNSRYRDKGLNIIGIALTDDREDWTAYVTKRGLHWTHLSTMKRWTENKMLEEYGVTSIPELILIGPDGRIVLSGLTGDPLRKRIEEIFGE